MTLALAAACGSTPERITLDPPTSETGLASTSTAPPPASSTPTTSTAPASDVAWTAAAGNLSGLPSECGNVSLVSGQPDTDLVIASVALQGLWATTDGVTWERLGAGGGSATITNRGSGIVYDPDRPGTFWESGIYNGGGIYRTDDGGRAFRRIGNREHADAVSVDFTDPLRATLLTNRHESSQLFRSRDGGQTWDDISASLPPGVGLTQHPLVLDAQTFLLGTRLGDVSGIYRSSDGGTTWSRMSEIEVTGAPLVEGDGSITWITTYGELVRSLDGGVTWSVIAPPGTVDPNAPTLIALPDGQLAAVGGSSVVVSDDRGATWRAVGPALPFVPTGLAYSPGQRAFYVWSFDCDVTGENPVRPDSISRLALDAGDLGGG